MFTVRHLKKYYQINHQRTLVINDISLDIETGSFVCIVGPSGCGKTTLLSLLSGLQTPDEGEIYLHGKPLTGPNANIGLVFQKANLMPWRTVFDNVLLPLQLQNLMPTIAKQRVMAALALVNLADSAYSYPRQLSGGMAQRVAIARALVQQPQILMLDEPFGALDALSRERLNLELLRIWHTSQQTILMVTHDIQEAVFLADKIIVLSHRPAQIATTLTIDLPRPRQPELIYEADFGKLAYQVRQAIQ